MPKGKKEGRFLSGRGLQTMQFIQGLLRAEDTLLPFKWERKLDPVYCKRLLRQLKFTDEEIEKLLAM